jgi:hypothetical protein
MEARRPVQLRGAAWVRTLGSPSIHPETRSSPMHVQTQVKAAGVLMADDIMMGDG